MFVVHFNDSFTMSENKSFTSFSVKGGAFPSSSVSAVCDLRTIGMSVKPHKTFALSRFDDLS